MHHLLTILLLAGSLAVSGATDTTILTLPEVVEMAKANSIASKQASTLKETKYWQWRTYRSNYNPQLSLSGYLPAYTKTFQQVVQPDGTVLFQPIHNDNSSLQLNFSQVISATGGTIYGVTSMQRYADFDRHNILFAGEPYGVGYAQPLFQYNKLKWDKKIEPLKYQESRQAYIESQEQISVTVEGYFFDLLLAQENLHIAESNLTNTQDILKVAKVKFDLGKVSKNEILQIQLEILNAQKSVGVARRDMEVAFFNLRSYTGLESNTAIRLVPPTQITQVQVSVDTIMKEAYENRSDAIAFVRRVAEAQRDVAIARGQNGLTANLTANLGYSKTSSTFGKVYQAPQDQQLLQLQFTVPILDWGRAKARTATAKANEQLVQYTVEQDKQTFRAQIVTQVSLFNLMKDQITITGQADSIANEKYLISKQRYVMGDLSITDLSISFEENDRARRDYIASLRDYWGAFYQLRYLSLYDFQLNSKITYK